jgi:hypothetical protein
MRSHPMKDRKHHMKQYSFTIPKEGRVEEDSIYTIPYDVSEPVV